MNSNDFLSASSPAQGYLDGLMEAVGARVQIQRSRSGVVPPPATGDPIVDSQNTVRWSRAIMQQKRQELEQARQEFERIKQQFRAQQTQFPPQMQTLFDALITMERTVMHQWLEDRTQPANQPLGQTPATAPGSVGDAHREPDAVSEPKIKLHA